MNQPYLTAWPILCRLPFLLRVCVRIWFFCHFSNSSFCLLVFILLDSFHFQHRDIIYRCQFTGSLTIEWHANCFYRSSLRLYFFFVAIIRVIRQMSVTCCMKVPHSFTLTDWHLLVERPLAPDDGDSLTDTSSVNHLNAFNDCFRQCVLAFCRKTDGRWCWWKRRKICRGPLATHTICCGLEISPGISI